MNSKLHPLFKLGKAAAKKDLNGLLFADLIKKKASLPTEYDFDIEHTGIPTPMFANDEHSCCVISGRAHQTLRFELIEQGSDLMITDDDVMGEYLKESGGQDSGLVVLDSLNEWVDTGWTAAGANYKIKAFSKISPYDHASMKQAIFMDLGVGLGLKMPISAQFQLQAGKPWDVTFSFRSWPGTWGGHYVYVCGYTDIGPVCITWGRKQQMTWKFIDVYCDEAFAIFDAKDTAKTDEHIDMGLVDQHLARVKPE